MPNNYFQFKQFKVNQDRCAMKVGTDGVLLGAWVKTDGVNKILDIGTGTGLIALMLAQRSMATIDALEIDPVAAKQAAENVKNSPWNNRIHVICGSFQNFSKENHKYDLIVCNPPFFRNSLRAPDLQRTIARHNDNLMIGELINGVKKILAPEGKFFIIWPYSDYNLVEKVSSGSGLYANKIVRILPSPGKSIKRVMVEFSFVNLYPEESILVIEKNGRHSYSEEYINLTKEYYL
jgi:tRNA1Val (adenine37-N6)-methyltransferase